MDVGPKRDLLGKSADRNINGSLMKGHVIRPVDTLKVSKENHPYLFEIVSSRAESGFTAPACGHAFLYHFSIYKERYLSGM